MPYPVIGNNNGDLTNRVKKLRIALKINQVNLANLLHISHGHMKNIEQNRVNMSIDVLIRMTEVLECTSDYLLGLDDDPGPKWKDRAF